MFKIVTKVGKEKGVTLNLHVSPSFEKEKKAP
jgi:hypothetical protein